ncbi:MAG: hypothetical protein R3332_05140 [Pseudohongiellaceae bacterium]|nr:hypothetical protein [Pseudohongiellaceae bacterium]
MKTVIYSVGIFLSIGILLARETLARLGLESNYLLIAVVALVATALLSQRSVFLTGSVLLLCLAINVPAEMMGNFQIDKDVMIASLLAIVLLPVVHNLVVR